MFGLAGRARPRRDARRRRRARTGEMAAAGYGAVGEFHYVHHQPDGTPYDEPNELAIAVARGGARGGARASSCIPAAYHRDGWDGGDRPPEAGQRRFCDPDVDAFLGARRTACARGRTDRPGVLVGGRRPQRARRPGRLARGDRRLRRTFHGLVRHVHAHEQRRELEECAAEHGCSPIELLAPHRLPRPAHERRPRHPRRRRATSRCLAASDTIVVSCPTTEGNLGDGHLPGDALPRRGRAAGDRQRLAGPDRPVRGGPRARDGRAARARRRATRCSPPTGDLWAELCRNGRASLGLETAPLRMVDIDLDHPDLAGVAAADLPLRAGHLRVGGRGDRAVSGLPVVTLDGRTLTPATVVAIARGRARGPHRGRCARAQRGRGAARPRAARARRAALRGDRRASARCAPRRPPSEDPGDHQWRLLLSHAGGGGAPLTVEVVRAAMAVRANQLGAGGGGRRGRACSMRSRARCVPG